MSKEGTREWLKNRDFRRLKEEIFPWGMESLSEYAKERGVELGLWFAPDSRDVYPIGDEPDGFSTTGFVCDLGQEKHLILFRECTEAKDASFGLDFEINEATLIASNTETTYELSKKAIKVSFGKKRSYVWLKIR